MRKFEFAASQLSALQFASKKPASRIHHDVADANTASMKAHYLSGVADTLSNLKHHKRAALANLSASEAHTEAADAHAAVLARYMGTLSDRQHEFHRAQRMEHSRAAHNHKNSANSHKFLI